MTKRVLLVHPTFPTTYWGFQESLAIIKTKASLPPLGLVTLAAYLPPSWDLRLVDLNIDALENRDLRWADVILMGGMLIQLKSMHEVISRAHSLDRPVVVGGPAPTTSPEAFGDADLIVQGEIEGQVDTLREALDSLMSPRNPLQSKNAGDRQRGSARILAAPKQHPSMSSARVPRFDLLKIHDYTSLSIQYSRGCPFHCEFCDIVEIFGHRPRVKSDDQVLAEIATLHRLGYTGSIFFVDDNFIGNKRTVQRLLPKLASWQRAHGRPFDFYTEASVNLAADERLMLQMIDAGFRSVFVGIETPSTEALTQAGKSQNLGIDLNEAIATLTRTGLEVMGGFIVGFDTDTAAIFEMQRAFIQRNPIPLAMVGLLIALPETALSRRLEGEGRLRGPTSGDQFGRPNFEPAMDERTLLVGYRKLMVDLYSPEAYYDRCEAYVRQAGPLPIGGDEGATDIAAFLRIAYHVGLRSPRRRLFWRLLHHARRAAPHVLKWAVVHALQGEHMIRYTQEHLLPRLDAAIRVIDAERVAASRALAPSPTDADAEATSGRRWVNVLRPPSASPAATPKVGHLGEILPHPA
ncbi:MAG: B12-binding domain-containing radical SAM protein [Deltaproteobacteria bacterium]|nr:B12-binding domain-containing radical SAM protein [Deltaproteobacteria bacterium]